MTAPNPITLTDAIARWLVFRGQLVALGGVRPSTHRNQSQIARTLQASTIGGEPLAMLRRSHIELWSRGRLVDHAPATVTGELTVLRQILAWCVDEQILKEKPRMPSVAAPSTERSLPADTAFEWFLVNLRGYHAAATHFMLLTGLAPHELARLQAQDFREDTAEIAIGHRLDFLVKQAARVRLIPLNPTALAIWHEASFGLRPSATVFPRENAMQRAMRRLFLSRADAPAECDGLTPKMMRKWFASKVATLHSEAVLQTLLGHAPGSPITRRHYIRSQAEQRRSAVDGLVL